MNIKRIVDNVLTGLPGAEEGTRVDEYRKVEVSYCSDDRATKFRLLVNPTLIAYADCSPESAYITFLEIGPKTDGLALIGRLETLAQQLAARSIHAYDPSEGGVNYYLRNPDFWENHGYAGGVKDLAQNE